MILKGEVTHEPFHSHDLLSNSLYCVPYTAYNFSLENLYWLKNNNPLIDIFLNSHYLFTWDCIDILKRNSVLGSSLKKLWILPYLTGEVTLKCLTF